MDDQQLRSAIEALLFVAGSTLSPERLKNLFEDVPKDRIEEQLRALQASFAERTSGIMLTEVAGGWQLVTTPEQAPWIRKFRSVKVSAKLSRPALETLAIIAYKQPITRAEVEAVRGVSVDGIVRNLMERRLIKIVGKKDVPGKPMLFGTSSEFLQHFGLKDLSALPTLKEFTELDSSEDAMEPVPDEGAGGAGPAEGELAEQEPRSDAGGETTADRVETAAAPEAKEAG